MKSKLFVLVLVFVVGHASAQSPKGKIKAKDLVGTQWTAVEIWNVSHYDGAEDILVSREDFGEWAAFVEIDFKSETELVGTQLDGKTYKCPYQLKKKMLSYTHIFNPDTQYAAEVYVEAKLNMVSSTQFTMEADFCQDGCVYRIEYEKE
ncbi:MAG: hypothetical protein KDC79_02515 [Cyclobacteriaceae bacterium]|nr:hypothetical protein [Cyclobacteriaceae bacterium]